MEPINARDLTEKWVKKELTINDVFEYVMHNIVGHDYDHKTLNHVTELCFRIYLWSTNQLIYQYYPGEFLTAIINNDLKEAVLTADEMNKTALWIYVQFLYNVAPGGWKTMFREDKKEEINQ